MEKTNYMDITLLDNIGTHQITDEKSNGLGLTVMKNIHGSFLLKGILSPEVIEVTPKQYLDLDEYINETMGKGIKDLTCQEFYRVHYEIKCQINKSEQ